MNIHDQTKISELIAANKGAIDALASVAKPFHRLRNPILRKVMASRVTLSEAAKMGGCTVADMIKVLSPLGFVYRSTTTDREEARGRPTWLVNVSEDEIDTFDVRPILENGADPLKEILRHFGKMKAGKILRLINSFVPTPLIRLLEHDKAEASFVEQVSETEYHTYFLRKGTKTQKSNLFFMHDEEGFKAQIQRLDESRIREIDVRSLEMPLPMQTILGELEVLPAENALFVLHKRVPVYLLEELTGKGIEIHGWNRGEGDVQMLFFYPNGKDLNE